MVALALALLGLLAYAYVGYPLLVAALARVAPRRLPTDDAFEPTVSALIPVHDGAAWVGAKIESLLRQDYPPEKLEVLLLSDGSTDATDALVGEIAAREPRVRLLRSDGRRGKPSALNALRREARGEALLLTDVRQPLAPTALRELVRMLAPPEVGCVSGNLVLQGETGAGLYWRYESGIRRAEARARGMVGATGPIYLLRRADLPELPEDTILDDMWIPMQLVLAGRATLLCERALAYDQAFADGREFQRKVRTLAGNYQLFARLPALLSPRQNPLWFETVSHKLLRLVCPWALVALVLSSSAALVAAPAAPARAALLAIAAGQALLYAAALAGARAGRVGAAARSFVVLNAAAIAGLWRFLRGRQKVTW